MVDGRLPSPPITETMGFQGGGTAEKGKVTFVGEPGEHLYNPIGSVHGGFAMTILDPPWAARCTRPWPPASCTPRSR